MVNIVDKYQYFQVASWVDPVTGNFARVNADGSLNFSGASFSSTTLTQVFATSADPVLSNSTYTTASVNLTGYQRVIAKQTGSWNVTVSSLPAVVLGTGSSVIGTVMLSTSGTTTVSGQVTIGTGSNVIGTVNLASGVSLSVSLSTINLAPGSASTLSLPISFGASGSNTVIIGSSSKVVRVYKMFFKCNAQTNLQFYLGTASSASGVMTFGPNEGLILDYSGEPWFTTGTGLAFIMSSSNAVSVSGMVGYNYV